MKKTGFRVNSAGTKMRKRKFPRTETEKKCLGYGTSKIRGQFFFKLTSRPNKRNVWVASREGP